MSPAHHHHHYWPPIDISPESYQHTNPDVDHPAKAVTAVSHPHLLSAIAKRGDPAGLDLFAPGAAPVTASASWTAAAAVALGKILHIRQHGNLDLIALHCRCIR